MLGGSSQEGLALHGSSGSGATAFPGPLEQTSPWGWDLGSAASTGTGHPQLQGGRLTETMGNLRSFKLMWVTAVFGDTSVL